MGLIDDMFSKVVGKTTGNFVDNGVLEEYFEDMKRNQSNMSYLCDKYLKHGMVVYLEDKEHLETMLECMKKDCLFPSWFESKEIPYITRIYDSNYGDECLLFTTRIYTGDTIIGIFYLRKQNKEIVEFKNLTKEYVYGYTYYPNYEAFNRYSRAKFKVNELDGATGLILDSLD